MKVGGIDVVALRKESVDRNDIETSRVCADAESLSARRAWIEIQRWRDDHARPIVALRKESVDRNHTICADHHKRRVALRKESVDRNFACVGVGDAHLGSLSARRAWIEMPTGGQLGTV